MADSKISNLTEVTAPASTDVVPIVNSSTTKKVTIANLVANSAPPGINITGAATVTGASFGLTGAISGAAIFGTNGIRYKNVASTLTDTTSSGTVATHYTNVFGANTLTATNATTITDAVNTQISNPVQGSNVILTNKWALGADSILVAKGLTTSALTDLLINPTTKASGNLIDAQVNSVSKFKVDNLGQVTSVAGVTAGTGVAAAGANGFIFTNNGRWWSPAASQIQGYNSGGTGLQALVLGATAPSTIGAAPTHGQTFSIIQAEELLTIGAGASTTTTMQIPANAVVMSVSTRVTTVIPVAVTYIVQVGATTCSTTAISTAAGTTDPGTFSGSFYNSTAQGVTITPNTAPLAATGVVRVTVTYYVITPPTS